MSQAKQSQYSDDCLCNVLFDLKKNQLINVHEHKVNCIHRSVNRFMIDLCSFLNVTKHAYQRNCISPLLPVHLFQSDFKINIHHCIHIYMYTIFDGKNFLHCISTSFHKLHITVCAKFFWFRSVPQNTNIRVGFGTLRKETEPLKNELYSFFMCFWNYRCKNMFLFHNFSKTFWEPFKIYMLTTLLFILVSQL